MKAAIIILLIGLALVESSPKGNLESRTKNKKVLPCSGESGIKSCTCDDGVTIVTPDGESCFQKKLKFKSCVCKDGTSWSA